MYICFVPSKFDTWLVVTIQVSVKHGHVWKTVHHFRRDKHNARGKHVQPRTVFGVTNTHDNTTYMNPYLSLYCTGTHNINCTDSLSIAYWDPTNSAYTTKTIFAAASFVCTTKVPYVCTTKQLANVYSSHIYIYIYIYIYHICNLHTYISSIYVCSIYTYARYIWYTNV